jgi:hypothetical protein
MSLSETEAATIRQAVAAMRVQIDAIEKALGGGGGKAAGEAAASTGESGGPGIDALEQETGTRFAQLIQAVTSRSQQIQAQIASCQAAWTPVPPQLLYEQIQVYAGAVAEMERMRGDAETLAAAGRGAILTQLQAHKADCEQAGRTFAEMSGQAAAFDAERSKIASDAAAYTANVMSSVQDSRGAAFAQSNADWSRYFRG